MDWELFEFIEKEMNDGKLLPAEIGEKYLRENNIEEPEPTCGAGTEKVKGVCQIIVEEESIIEEPITTGKCGTGTHFNSETNSCVLD